MIKGTVVQRIKADFRNRGHAMDNDLEKAALACNEADKLNKAGLSLLHHGDIEGAFAKFVAGLGLLKGHPRSKPLMDAEGALTGNLAQVYIRRGNIDDAMNALEDQMCLATAVENIQGVTNALNSLAICHTIKGNLEEAECLYKKRLAIAQDIGDKKGEGNTLNNLAQVYIERRLYGPATAILRQRIAIAQAIGDRRGEATSLLSLGQIYDITAKFGEAEAVLHDALAILTAERDPRIQQTQSLLAELAKRKS